MLKERCLNLNVPNLEGFALKPYVALVTPQVERRMVPRVDPRPKLISLDLKKWRPKKEILKV